ncbi:MAG: hypothetical protein U9O24_05945 [Campylobacterota bacterium]|nr:hypothetical protein [Campylobacterota bacterium]
MQSDFEPKHLKDANKALSKHLDDVKVYSKKEPKEEREKERAEESSLWKKFLTLFR